MSTRITAQLSRYGEVVVSLLPSEKPPARLSPAPSMPAGRCSHYDAWIYSKLALPVHFGAASMPAPAVVPPELGGLPLVGREELGVTWRGYGDVLGALYGGDDAVRELRARVFGGMSDGLARLLTGWPAAARRRLWWSCGLPELEAIPWESIVLGPRQVPDLSFVRGIPGESVPPFTLAPEQRLRVAVLDPGCAAPGALCEALDHLAPEIEVHWLAPREPREALREVARAGFEVVHVVADGSAPLGLEGLLELAEEADAALSLVDLRTLLCGSRATILALTPPEVPRVGPSGLPTVFHAFTRLGHGIDWGPTIVAEVGPMTARARRAYWSTFYRQIAASLDVEDAAAHAAERSAPVPVALFLRHRFGRQFARRATEPSSAGRKAEQVTADLSVSRRLLDAARTLEETYASRGIAFPGHDLLEEERARQARLASALDDALFEEKEDR